MVLTRTDKDVESLFCESLAERIGQERFDKWFANLVHFSIRDERLVVSVTSSFLRDWICKNYSHIITDLSRTLFQADYSVDFITEDLSQKTPVKTSPSEGVIDVRTDSESIRLLKTASAEPASVSGKPASSRKKSLSQGRSFASYSSFVTGLSNRTAKGITDIVIDRPGTLNPVFLYGPTSVGKTHLLEGVYSEYRKNRGRKVPKYLTADEFVSLFVRGFQEREGNRGFRARFNDASLLIIEDIQMLEKKDATQQELIHLIDLLIRRGVQIVFSADRPLADLTGLKPELLSRIESGIVCGIEVPERETLLRIFSQMAENRALNIPDDVARFVVSRYTTHARHLSGALNRLYAARLTTGHPITIDLAAKALADLVPRRKRPISLEEIEKAVAETFNLTAKDLRGRSRSRLCAHPRMLAMWLARKYTRNALSEIGRHFGNRSHSTVVAAQKKVETWLAGSNSEWKEAPDILRRVERILLADRC